MQWAKFKAVYTENWIPAWNDDNLDIWIRDIERHDVEERLMLPTLQRMAANIAKRSETESPRMSHILSAYEAAQTEDARLTPGPRLGRLCPACGRSGWGWGAKNMSGVWVDPLRPCKIPGPLYITLIPCACEYYTQTGDGAFPMPVRRQLARYIIATPGDTLNEDDDRSIALCREYVEMCEYFEPTKPKAATHD